MSSVSNSAARDKRHLPPFGKHDSITQVTRATASRLDVMIATVGINVLSLAMPVVILQVYDRVIPNQATPTLLLFILGLGAVLLLDAAFNLARSYVTGWSAARTQHILGTMAITRLLDADLQTVERVPPGIQLQRLRAIDTVKNFYAGQAVLAAIDLPFVLLFIRLIALIAGELALIPAVILLLTAAAAARSGRQLRTALDGRSRMDDRRHNFIIEVLAKIRTVKFLGFETLLIRRYERLQGSSAEQTYWVTYFSSMARSIGGIFSELTMVSVAAYGSILVVNSSLSVGSLAACTFLAGRSAQPMLRAFGLWTQFQGVQLAREQVEAVLDLSQERGKDSAPAPNITGRLELRNVAFGYGEDGPDLLRNINLKIEAGETVGITGYNGSGKTTLLSLILGLLVPTSGHVLLDGMEPKDLDPLGLRSQICYIPQSGSLFHGTILENLTMFRGDEFAESAVRNANLLGLKTSSPGFLTGTRPSSVMPQTTGCRAASINVLRSLGSSPVRPTTTDLVRRGELVA